ncbi:DUF2141 domain-containing protein [Imperialibacter roseus]|uniref:DUF2141 domain-containing protein n=1 Tax=Imperialibacter roseus TaxID=1324217 RepID=A0ABZ0IWX3_9BACT|nr:DUF2141 domain-containing protein [Imperialibacter roseus]WOK09557.1 DUF2141 domain-containing protein [Imperialibacter roseus]
MLRLLFAMTFPVIVGSVELSAQNCKITVSGLRNDKGQVTMYVFDNAIGFPEERERASQVVSETISNKESVFVLQVTPGDYAVTFLHDENLDGEMQYSWIGMPTEGFGFSNDPRVKLSAPSFDACRFRVTKDGCALTVKAKYF